MHLTASSKGEATAGVWAHSRPHTTPRSARGLAAHLQAEGRPTRKVAHVLVCRVADARSHSVGSASRSPQVGHGGGIETMGAV